MALNASHSAAKRADLLSGLGAIVLGAGLALLAPTRLAGSAWLFLILIAGGITHGAGMYMKHHMGDRALLDMLDPAFDGRRGRTRTYL